MGVDVVIVNWNGGPELLRAVRSAVAFGGRPIIVDNASTEGSIDDVEALADATVIRHARNVGFAAASNAGAAAGSQHVVMLLNPDAEILQGTADHLEAAFEATGAMLLGPLLVNDSGRPIPGLRPLPTTAGIVTDLLRITQAQSRLGRGGVSGENSPTRSMPSGEAGWHVGSALAMRRVDWSALGGLDDGYFLWYEDIDLGARVRRAGGRLAVAEGVLIRHAGASTWGRLPRWRRQWLRAVGARRYARRNLGLASALTVALVTPPALAIGLVLDIAHLPLDTLRRRAI